MDARTIRTRLRRLAGRELPLRPEPRAAAGDLQMLAELQPELCRRPTDREDAPVLVVTHGRSGSTLLTGLLNSIDGFAIRGENAATFIHVHRSLSALALADSRSADDPEGPWANEVDWPTVAAETERFARSLLCGSSEPRVYGFKEIRYLPSPGIGTIRTEQDFACHLDFLTAVAFPGARIIFNTRSIDETTNSGWFRGRADAAKRLATAHRWFDDYARTHDGCFATTYDDLSSHTSVIGDLFEFLGEPYDRDAADAVLRTPHGYSSTGRFETP